MKYTCDHEEVFGPGNGTHNSEIMECKNTAERFFRNLSTEEYHARCQSHSGPLSDIWQRNDSFHLVEISEDFYTVAHIMKS